MSNGIDWFRWHHGSVDDGKLGVIAKRALASVAEVIAVWACLLEAASANDERGHPGRPDWEAIELRLGLDEGKGGRIYTHMVERGLIDADTGRIVAWERRQVKREDSRSSTDRVRESRGRRAAENVVTDDETACNHTQPQETTREEKRREEKSKPGRTKTAPPAAAFDPLAELTSRGVAAQTATDWLQLRKSKRAPVSRTVLEKLDREVAQTGLSMDAVLELCCGRGWVGFEAGWILRDARAAPGAGGVGQLGKAGQATARNAEAFLREHGHAGK